MSTVNEGRAKLRPALVVLLVFVTIANVAALALTVMAWQDELSHGGDLAGLMVFASLLTVIGLVGIGGAWARRSWGPPLYFGAQATGFLLTLVAAPSAIGPLTFVPLVLAGLLWALSR